MPSSSQVATDRNLLFGILALQMDFISRDALITAMNAWVLDKGKPLAQVLVEQKALSGGRRAMLEPLVEEHVRQHGNDPEKSLSAISSISSVHDHLKDIRDPDVQASLVHMSAPAVHPSADPHATRASTVGVSTSSGQRFRILRPHAKGGLGEVFVARDEELHREVALKEIQDRHADDENSRARFLQEAEITGGLEHPNIVPVYGLGRYPDGRPFYAMRFVRGDSLKEAIERFHKRSPVAGERALEFRKLLARFIDICNAIAYAHARGVLHRDLKPGNVMLGQYGETLVVDWGLAKAVGRREYADGFDDATLRPGYSSGTAPTLAGSTLGTPPFMSPEQASGRLDQLGPATDVYSLGATLYCLLTGRPPFEDTDSGGLLGRVQKVEFLPPRQVKPDVPAPLEAICLKAMALRPADRYPSARALADDVEHWLADEPVSGYTEPWRERARRWRKRHRTLVTAAAAALVVAVAALAGGVLLLVLANNRERLLRLEAASERDRALHAEEQTRQSEAEARATLQFFTQQVLAAARPKGQDGGLGRDATIRAAMDAAEPGIGKAFTNQPLVEAGVRDALGVTYLYLGEPALAVNQLRQAVSLRERVSGVDNPDTLRSMNNLAIAYADAGQLADALPLYEQTLQRHKTRFGPEHPRTLASMNNLANAYRDGGRPAEALALKEQTLNSQKATLGPEHPDTLAGMSNLAIGYFENGRLTEALSLWEEALKGQKAKLGPDHPDTLGTMTNLGIAYREAGRAADALALCEETLKLQKSRLGADHPDTLAGANNLALAYADAGRIRESLTLYEETLKLEKAKLGPDHPETLLSMGNLAEVQRMAGRLTEALSLLELIVKLSTAKLGAEHPDTLTSMNQLADAYREAGRVADAEPLLRKSLAVWEKKSPDDWRRFWTMSLLGGARLAQKQYTDAEPLLLQADAGLQQHRAEIPVEARTCPDETRARLVALYNATGKKDQAAAWRKKHKAPPAKATLK